MLSLIERGTITRVSGRQVFVEVPKLGVGMEFGPCDVAWQSDQTLPANDGGTGATSHSHNLPAPAVGQRVIVATIHGIPDDLVVLGIIG